MDIDSTADAAKEEQLQEDSDDSCILDYIEIVPLTEDTDGSRMLQGEDTLQAEDPDDSCILEYIEILPVTRDINGLCATECVTGDRSAGVMQEHLAVVKQESEDVCCVIYVIKSVVA